MKSLLEVHSLTRRYGQIVAVDGISFHINTGQCFGLLGPNGAGKTTTIEMMEGILQPDSGSVYYKGEPLGQMFRSECGIQFQNTALQEFLSVRETLKLFQGLYPNSADLDELIQRCHLQEFLENDNRELSGGQRQRLLLAIALINNPEIVFLDEPTTGLDPQSRHNFWDLIRDILKRGTTVILTTHYMEEAAELCDELIIMDHGCIIAQGTPQELLTTHFSERLVSLPAHSLTHEQQQRLSGTALELQYNKEAIEVLTSDINQTLKILLEIGIDLNAVQIHQRNLEDLFLKLTGHDLRV